LSGKRLHVLERFVRNTSSLFMYVSMAMLFIMMVLGTVDVIGRYFFDKPISGTFEITEILLAGIVFFGIAHTQHLKGHVSVSLAYSRFPDRLKLRVGLLNSIVLISIFGLMSWRGIVTAISQWQQHREIINLGWPHFPFQLFVPVGALTLCLVLLVEMLQYLIQMRKED